MKYVNSILKILLFFILIAINACGFKPTLLDDINVNIIATNHHPLAHILKKHLKQVLHAKLSVEIKPEQKHKKASSYEGHSISHYRLTLDIPIKIYDVNHKLLFSKTLNHSAYVRVVDSALANEQQQMKIYHDLRLDLAEQLVKQLKILHATAL